ncbi:MAG: transposase [Polyangiaceae bacterium]
MPGRTYMFTRRCSERRFFLLPDAITFQVILYCLAFAVQRFGLIVYAVGAMSNHYHAVIHDPEGRYPAFLALFHKLVAKVQNARWGRWEALWASEQTSVVELIEPQDVFDKIVYTLANPVADHLVARVTEWPGLSSYVAQLRGKTMTARRPRWFFAKQGRMPEEATLELHRPPGFEHLSDQAWRDKLRAAIAAIEAKTAAERATTGRRILGRKVVLRQRASDSPTTPAPRRQLSPRVAAKNKWRRAEALRRNRSFQHAYRSAREARRAGRDAVFPYGTYLLARLGLVTVAPAPS